MYRKQVEKAITQLTYKNIEFDIEKGMFDKIPEDLMADAKIAHEATKAKKKLMKSKELFWITITLYEEIGFSEFK